MAIASMTTQCAVAATERPIGVATRNPTTTIKHVAIDLRFDWKAKQAYGSTAITPRHCNRHARSRSMPAN